MKANSKRPTNTRSFILVEEILPNFPINCSTQICWQKKLMMLFFIYCMLLNFISIVKIKIWIIKTPIFNEIHKTLFLIECAHRSPKIDWKFHALSAIEINWWSCPSQLDLLTIMFFHRSMHSPVNTVAINGHRRNKMQ